MSAASEAQAMPAQTASLGRSQIGPAMLVLSLPPFLSVLDLTLVNITLPHIAGNYGATPNEATLVVTFFAIAQAISMPLSGALALRFGVMRMLMFSLAGFALASLLCGAAPSLNALIASRVLQGLAAGPIIQLSQSMLQRTFPPRYVPMALTVFGVAMMTGPLVGPALGGILADTVGWRWGFLINVPIAALCVMLAAPMFKGHESTVVKQPIDGVGLGLMVVWVTAVQVVLDQGRDHEWFASGYIVTLSIVAAIGFVAFLIWETTDAHPIVDLSVFRYRSFAVAAPVTAIAYGAATGSALLVYLWLQTGLHYDATTAGYVAALTGVPGIIASPIVAWLSNRVDLRVMATIGILLSVISMLVRTQFIMDIDFAHVIIPQFLNGLSGAFFWGSLIAIGMSEIPREKISSAAGLLTFTRTLAFAMQVALLTTFWDRGAKQEHEGLSWVLNQPQTALDVLGNQGLQADQAMVVLNGQVDAQSTLIAMQHLFWFLAAMNALCAVAIWFAPLRKTSASPAPLQALAAEA